MFVDTDRLTGWSKHETFGLRKEWLKLYLDHPCCWQEAATLGNRQIESLNEWLKTAGLLDSDGSETFLTKQLRVVGTEEHTLWEYLWVNVTFNFATANWYVSNIRIGEYDTSQIKNLLRTRVSRLSERTCSNAVTELVGLFEHTPVGSELKQGEVDSSCRPRRVRREGLPDPSTDAIVYALRLLFARSQANWLSLDRNALWPWVIFGSDKGHVLQKLVANAADEFEIVGNVIRSLTSP